MTDDERRRVARNIRKNYIRAGIGYRIASSYNIALAVGIVPEMLVEDIELWNRLADLIDPGDVMSVEICELVGDGMPEGEPLPPIVDREALLSMAGDIEGMMNRLPMTARGCEYFVEVPRTLLDSIVSCIREACVERAS